jgi:four helix bundle protein
MASNDLLLRTKSLAHRCVKLSVSLPGNELGKYLKGQLIRSSISVAANYRAACVAQSKKQFISKISIALEESDETKFWIEFIEDENLIVNSRLQSIKNEADSITKILAASRLTARKKLKKV